MIDDVDELLALRAGDKYRLNDIRRRLEIYKRLYISDLEFVRNLSKAYLGKDLSPEPRRPKPGSAEKPQAESVPEPQPSAAPKPRQVQAGTGKKSRQQELEEYERQYLSKSGIKAGAEGFTITEDGEVGKKTKKKSSKPRKAAKKTKKTAKKTTTKTRKPRKKKETKQSSCSKCGSEIGPDEAFCTNCGAKKAGSISPLIPSAPEPEPSSPKPSQVQTGTGKKSRQQELDEYERQYLSKSGIKAGAEGFAITEDGEVGEITKKKTPKPRKAARKTKKVAKKTTTKTRKPRKKKEPESGFCVKCGSKIAVDDMFCTNCGSKR